MLVYWLLTASQFLPSRCHREFLARWFSGASDVTIARLAVRLSVYPTISRGRRSSFSEPSLDAPDVYSHNFMLRWELWRLAKESGRFPTIPINWFGGIKVPAKLGTDSSLGPFVFAEYEPTEMFWASQHLREGSTVIDLGANDGWYTFFFRHLVGESGKVVAVDANSRAVEHLKRTSLNANLVNVLPVHMAIWSHSSQLVLKVSQESHSGHTTVGDFVYEETQLLREELVDAESLDFICRRNSIDNIDFIKLDIEGAEAHAIQGMQDILRRDKPTLLIEMNDASLAMQGSSPLAIAEMLSPFGYRMYWIGRARCDLLQYREPGDDYAIFVHERVGLRT